MRSSAGPKSSSPCASGAPPDNVPVNTTKTLEGFDFSVNPSINRQQVLALASGDDIRAKRNILICGPTGVGKSHVAQALAHDACRQGYDVLFVATHKMLQHINGGRADGTPMAPGSGAWPPTCAPPCSSWTTSASSRPRGMAPLICTT